MADPLKLDDYDRAILKGCPATMMVNARPTRIDAAKMKRVRRLWTAGLLSGTVGSDGKSLKLTIRDAGRLAIGRPAIEAPRDPAEGGAAVTDDERLAAIRGDETRWWLCQTFGDGDSAALVLGWSAMVKRLAADCIDFKGTQFSVALAEEWLTRNVEEWDFGRNGTATWRVDFEDGGWAATLVTDASTVIAP